MYEHSVVRGNDIAWIAEKSGHNNTIGDVKKQVFKQTPIICHKSYLKKGSITQDIISTSKYEIKDSSHYFPLSTENSRLCDVTKYGGKSGISTAAYTLISFGEKKKEIRRLESIPLFLLKDVKLDSIGQELLLDYYRKKLSKNGKKNITDVKIIYPIIPLDSLLRVDGYYYYLGGRSKDSVYLYNAVPLKMKSSQYYYVKKIYKALEKHYYAEKDKDGKQILTKEENLELYKEITKKLCNGIFKSRKGSLASTLEKQGYIFETLTLENQCLVLKSIIDSFSSCTKNVDLSLIDAGKNVGTIQLSINISNLKECVLINQSITGLYENEVDLLHI